MNFAKNRTLFPKMPKLGTSSLKQCAFLNGKRVLFSSRKIYEAGPIWGPATSAAMLHQLSGFRPHGFQVKKMEHGRREETQTV